LKETSDTLNNIFLTQNRTYKTEQNPDDGKRAKMFGFDLLILQFLTF